MEATTPAGLHSKSPGDHNRFVIDLTAYERRRLCAVLEAMPDWDPAAVLAAETQAHALLYPDPMPSSALYTTYCASRGCSMLDADADPGRRAWVACPSCGDDGCITCPNRKTCDLHWQYLLASEARLLFLQCHVCMQRWWHDGRCGVGGDRPDCGPLWVFATYHGDAA